MLLFAVTGLGTPLLVTVRSHTSLSEVTTVVLLLAELGSLVVEVIDEFAVMDATTTEAATFTVTMMSADTPKARFGSVQFTLPVAPTAGVVQVQPTGAETEAKVVLAGVASVKLTAVAAPGPLFVTVCV